MAENLPTRGRKRGNDARPTLPVPRAPVHLSDESKRLWVAIMREWVIGPEAVPLLRAGLECWDAYQVCRAQLVVEGPTITPGDGGMARVHPAAKVGMDALREFRSCFRQLGLEPPDEK
jgi:P27 family predicted phage terminase small subunit